MIHPNGSQVGQYFGLIKGLQSATNKTEQLSAILNAGQAIILAGGMASVMFAAVLVGRYWGETYLHSLKALSILLLTSPLHTSTLL